VKVVLTTDVAELVTAAIDPSGQPTTLAA
jgi:hypothetical protein